MEEYKEKSSSGIRNVHDDEAIYPAGTVEPLHKTKEDIRPMPQEARPEQEKKSDTRYVGESSKGVKKTKMSFVHGDGEEKKERKSQNEGDDLIEHTTWEIPQPEKDKDFPL